MPTLDHLQSLYNVTEALAPASWQVKKRERLDALEAMLVAGICAACYGRGVEGGRIGDIPCRICGGFGGHPDQGAFGLCKVCPCAGVGCLECGGSGRDEACGCTHCQSAGAVAGWKVEAGIETEDGEEWCRGCDGRGWVQRESHPGVRAVRAEMALLKEVPDVRRAEINAHEDTKTWRAFVIGGGNGDVALVLARFIPSGWTTVGDVYINVSTGFRTTIGLRFDHVKNDDADRYG